MQEKRFQEKLEGARTGAFFHVSERNVQSEGNRADGVQRPCGNPSWCLCCFCRWSATSRTLENMPLLACTSSCACPRGRSRMLMRLWYAEMPSTRKGECSVPAKVMRLGSWSGTHPGPSRALTRSTNQGNHHLPRLHAHANSPQTVSTRLS